MLIAQISLTLSHHLSLLSIHTSSLLSCVDSTDFPDTFSPSVPTAHNLSSPLSLVGSTYFPESLLLSVPIVYHWSSSSSSSSSPANSIVFPDFSPYLSLLFITHCHHQVMLRAKISQILYHHQSLLSITYHHYLIV